MKTSHAKKLSLTLCAAVLTLAGASAVQAQNIKVGMVDMNKVFSGYYKTKDAEKKITDSRDAAKKELDDRMDSHKLLLDEINQLGKNAESSALSASAKADLQKKREDKISQVKQSEQSINEFRGSREKQLQESAVRVRNQLVEEIMKVVSAKVKSENYDIVLDKSGQSLNGVQIVLHASDKMDFSDDVITSLNKNRAADTVASSAASATPAAASSPKPSATPKKPN